MSTIYRGYALSGLEFGSSFPGTEGIDYFQSANGLFAYTASKGSNVIRLAMKWERLQPDSNGSINSTYLSQIDDQITKASNNGQKVIIDCHNYGRKKVNTPGGITETFSASSDNFTGNYSIGSGVLSANQWNRVSCGHASNPVSPADSYKITVDATITSNGGSDIWRELWIEVYREDDNNKYFFVMNNLGSVIRLYKQINGVNTELQSKTYTIDLNTAYTIIIDVGQETPGTIKVKINGTTELSGSVDASLTGGQVAFYGSGVNWKIDNFTLDIDGDTSAGGITERTINHADGILTTAHFADFWDKVSEIYKNNDTVIGYDLMNEPHDMPVPTTTSNYSTTATATVMYQAAVDAIRANNDSKYCIVQLDHWANIHQFTTLYGTSPTPWITDALSKTIYSAHSYWDSDHSGTYSGGWDSDNRLANMHEEVIPFMEWCQDQGVLCFIGEFGTPSDDDRWLSSLYTFYKYMDDYGVWGATYWALGDAYSSTTSIQPTSSYTVDLRTMQVAESYPGGTFTPYAEGRKLKFQCIDTMSWSKDSMRGHEDSGGGYTLAQIDAWTALIAQMGATHIAIDCPLDAYTVYPVSQDMDANSGINYLRNWVDKARKYNLNVIFRGTFIGFEGLYDADIETYSIRSPGVKTQLKASLSAGSWLKKIYDFIVDNGSLSKTYGDLIEENDILAFFPEPTSHQFYPSNPAQGQTEAMFSSNSVLSQFYFDLKVVMDIALATIGKRGCYTGMSSCTISELTSGYITTIFYKAANVIPSDHYEEDPAGWMQDITDLHSTKSFLGTTRKSFIQEFGDIYNSDPTDRATLVQEYLDQIDANLSKFNGINYWAAPTALINSAAFTLTPAGTVVMNYFAGTAVVPEPEPEPDPSGSAVASGVKPIMTVGRTNAQISEQGLTYNQAGITYNNGTVKYAGIYEHDIIPMVVKIR